jgi:nicotinamide mononucleotide (NMN) deamidase PncC
MSLVLLNLMAAASVWRDVELSSQSHTPTSLSALADRAASSLRAANQRVSCFESTTGGLMQASLLATAGASKITTCGAISYTSSRSAAVLGSDAMPFDEPLDEDGHRCRPQNAAEYVASKQERVAELARRKRVETGADWCLVENGAAGPTFNYDDLHAGFSALYNVAGPHGDESAQHTHTARPHQPWSLTTWQVLGGAARLRARAAGALVPRAARGQHVGVHTDGIAAARRVRRRGWRTSRQRTVLAAAAAAQGERRSVRWRRSERRALRCVLSTCCMRIPIAVSSETCLLG